MSATTANNAGFQGSGVPIAAPIYLVDSTGAPLNTAANPLIDQDQVRALIFAGQAFEVTTGLVASATNGNLYGGLQILAANLPKNIFIYFIDIFNVNVSGDSELRMATAADAGLTGVSPPTPQNLQYGNATVSGASVYWTASGFSNSFSPAGTLRWQGGSPANVHQFPITIPGDGILLPKGSTQALGIYTKLPAAGDSYAMTARYVEF